MIGQNMPNLERDTKLMSNIKYCAFLKFKRNEVLALNDLTDELKEKISVFFDMPNELPFKSRQDSKDEFSPQELLDFKNQKFLKKIEEQKKYFSDKINWLNEFYFDNYDIDPSVSIDNNTYNYQTIIDNFASLGMIPVCGVDDRVPQHLECIINSKNIGKFKTDKIAIRITESVFEDYEYIEDEFTELIETLDANFSKIILIFDLRCIKNEQSTLSKLINFLNKINLLQFHEIIISGSTIPSSIKDLLNTSTIINIDRKEIFVFTNIFDKVPNICLGDYTCISPDTNFLDLYIEDIASRMTGKIFYIYQNKVCIARSSKLRGNKAAFKPLLDYIIAQPFFRGEHYSFGDKYIFDKHPKGTEISAASIIRPNVNLHISYMLRDFSI